MSILTDFEDRIGNAVEGLFAGAFRSPVQPVELAKSLAKAMDDGRSVGIGKVYAPTSYKVAVSREDKRHLGEFTGTLEGELATYLTDHARERGYHLTTRPKVDFVIQNDLKLGRFRVAADLGGAPSAAVEPSPEEPRPAAASVRAPSVTIEDSSQEIPLSGERMVAGRLNESDIPLSDVNVSRQHAAFVPDAGGWTVEDLGSTNGTLVNGKKVERASLKDGDVVEIGATRLVFHGQRG
jgi:hypothetical protein